jgi:hypothetical protein
LIKMATGQLSDAYGNEAASAPPMAAPVRRNALDVSRPSGLGPNAASGVLRSAYAEWTVNLFSQCRV